ncbi:MAG TPA: FtsQ-type POTRA domain-containing protein [Vicinamibacterales bacterium]|nr:FtsQ-type POTRA domain-containing protein [Vicinamibacterales bacterium]
MSVSAPADRRFRRPSVRPAQRRSLRRLLHWPVLRAVLVVVGLLGGVYWAVTFVTGASLLRVTRVTVRGNSRLSTGEVLALVSDLRGANVLTADLGDYRRRLVDSPWVADARLRRILPSAVEIAIEERVPIGLCRLVDRLYLVDGTGAIIDEYGPRYADLDLPIIDGLAGAPREGAATIDPGRAELAARAVQAIASHRALARRVSQIDVTDPHDAVVILDGETALLHLGDTQFAERLQSYVELEPALRARVPEIDYVDLRFDQRVYVRPAKPGNRARD